MEVIVKEKRKEENTIECSENIVLYHPNKVINCEFWCTIGFSNSSYIESTYLILKNLNPSLYALKIHLVQNFPDAQTTYTIYDDEGKLLYVSTKENAPIASKANGFKFVFHNPIVAKVVFKLVIKRNETLDERIKLQDMNCLKIYNQIESLDEESLDKVGSLEINRTMISPYDYLWNDICPEEFTLYVTQQRIQLWNSLESFFGKHLFLTGLKGIGKSITLVYLALNLRKKLYFVFHHRFNNGLTPEYLIFSEILLAIQNPGLSNHKECISELTKIYQTMQNSLILLVKCIECLKKFTDANNIYIILDQIEHLKEDDLQILQTGLKDQNVIFASTSNNKIIKTLQAIHNSLYDIDLFNSLKNPEYFLSQEAIDAIIRSNSPDLLEKIKNDKEKLIGNIPLLANIFINLYIKNGKNYPVAVQEYQIYINRTILKKVDEFIEKHQDKMTVLDNFLTYLAPQHKKPMDEETFLDELPNFDFHYISFEASIDSMNNQYFSLTINYPFVKQFYLTKCLMNRCANSVTRYRELFFEKVGAGELYQKLFGLRMLSTQIKNYTSFLQKNINDPKNPNEIISCNGMIMIHSMIYFLSAQKSVIYKALNEFITGQSLLIIPTFACEPATDLYKLTFLRKEGNKIVCNLIAIQTTINKNHDSSDNSFFEEYLSKIISNLQAEDIRVNQVAFYWVTPYETYDKKNANSGLIQYEELPVKQDSAFTVKVLADAKFLQTEKEEKSIPFENNSIIISLDEDNENNISNIDSSKNETMINVINVKKNEEKDASNSEKDIEDPVQHGWKTMTSFPKRPINQYIRFVRDNKDKVQAEYPQEKPKEIHAKIVHSWKELTSDQKKGYKNDEYLNEIQIYNDQVKEFQDKGSYLVPTNSKSNKRKLKSTAEENKSKRGKRSSESILK